MIRLRLNATTLATSCNFWKLYVPLEMKDGSARDARLQTAVSSGEEYSMISVQRLEDLMVPRFCWLDLPAMRRQDMRTNSGEGLTIGGILVEHEGTPSFNL